MNYKNEGICDGVSPGYYADPTDCRSFFHCQGSTAVSTKRHCEAGFVWNPEKFRCSSLKRVNVTELDCELRTQEETNGHVEHELHDLL